VAGTPVGLALVTTGFRCTPNAPNCLNAPSGNDSGIHHIREIKGNIEVEMVVEAISASTYWDTLVMFSGSGELVPSVKAVQRQGCQVVIVSSERTAESTVSSELRCQTDIFLELDTLRSQIEMPLQVLKRDPSPS
jgi:uncharacterized LabA/DUF88 family protein